MNISKKLLLGMLFMLCVADQAMAMKRSHGALNSNIIDLIDEKEEPCRKKLKKSDDEAYQEKGNSWFDELPDEVLLIIYEFLDLESMYKLGKTTMNDLGQVTNRRLHTLFNKNKCFLNKRLGALMKFSRLQTIPIIFLMIQHDDKWLLEEKAYNFDIKSYDYKAIRWNLITPPNEKWYLPHTILLCNDKDVYNFLQALHTTLPDNQAHKLDHKKYFLLSDEQSKNELARDFPQIYQCFKKNAFELFKQGFPNILDETIYDPALFYDPASYYERKLNPLCYAIRLKKKDLVNLLIQKGVPFSSSDSDIVWQAGDDEIIDSLINGKKQLEYGLHYAVSTGNDDLVDYYVYSTNKSFNEVCNDCKYPNFKGETPLSLAIKADNFSMVESLLEEVSVSNISQLINVETDVTINIAVHKGNTKIVDLLVKKGFPLGNKDNFGKTPLIRAYESNNKALYPIIYNGIQAKSSSTLKFPIHYAAQGGSCSLMKKFHAEGAQLDACDRSKKAPVHYAIESQNHNCISYLLSNGVDINQKGENNKTPLHYAVELESEDLTEFFLKCGADPLAQDIYGKNPVEYALEKATSQSSKLDKIIELLVDYGGYAHKEYRGKSRGRNTPKEYFFSNSAAILKTMVALETAKESPWLPFYEYTKEAGDLKYKLDYFRVNTGSHENPDGKDIYGKTRLHYAAQLADLKSVEEYLYKGAMVDVEDFVKRTPLHYASWNIDGYAVVKALLEAGANPSHTDCYGKRAIDYVKMIKSTRFVYKYDDIIELLESPLYQNNALKKNKNFQGQRQDVIQHMHNNMIMQKPIQPQSIQPQDSSKQAAILVDKLRKLQLKITSCSYKNFELQDEDGNTLLHYACQLGGLEYVKKLILCKVDPNICNNMGKTPLMYALESGNQQLLQELLNYLSQCGRVTPLKNPKINNYSDLNNAAAWTHYPPCALQAYNNYKKSNPISVQIPHRPNAGIVNESGTDCFMNASLQVLSKLSEVQKVLMNNSYSPGSIADKLKLFFNRLQTEPQALQGSNSFRADLIKNTDDLTLKKMYSGQQDAQEFISALLLNVDEKIQNLFRFELQYFTHCQSGCAVLANNEEHSVLSLPLPIQSEPTRMDKILSDFFGSEKVEGYQCEHCKNNGASRSVTFKKLPEILILAAKRFNYENNNGARVDTPLATQEILELRDDEGIKKYQLRGIVLHRGTLERGHYYAYAKSEFDKYWYRYNDADSITELHLDFITSPLNTPYLYFYSKI